MIGNQQYFDKATRVNAVASVELKNGMLVQTGALNGDYNYVFDAAAPDAAAVAAGDFKIVYLDPRENDPTKSIKDFKIDADTIFTAVEPIQDLIMQVPATHFESAPTVGEWAVATADATTLTPSGTVPTDAVYFIVLDDEALKINGRTNVDGYTLKAVVIK